MEKNVQMIIDNDDGFCCVCLFADLFVCFIFWLFWFTDAIFCRWLYSSTYLPTIFSIDRWINKSIMTKHKKNHFLHLNNNFGQQKKRKQTLFRIYRIKGCVCCDPERMRNSEWKNPPEKERKIWVSGEFTKKKNELKLRKGEKARDSNIIIKYSRINIRERFFCFVL